MDVSRETPDGTTKPSWHDFTNILVRGVCSDSANTTNDVHANDSNDNRIDNGTSNNRHHATYMCDIHILHIYTYVVYVYDKISNILNNKQL